MCQSIDAAGATVLSFDLLQARALRRLPLEASSLYCRVSVWLSSSILSYGYVKQQYLVRLT